MISTLTKPKNLRVDSQIQSSRIEIKIGTLLALELVKERKVSKYVTTEIYLTWSWYPMIDMIAS